MKEALKAAGDQFKGTDRYLLKDYEHLADDEEHIICDLCGGVRYIKKNSAMFGKDYWAVAERQGRALLPVLTGCICQQKARHRISAIRDGEWKDVADGKGKMTNTFIEGNHSDIIYNGKRYIYSVPAKYRNQWIESERFWTLTGDSQYGYQKVRNMLENVMMEGDITESFALYGSESATALLCAIRTAMITYGVPCIMMDTKTILFHRSNSTPMADELESVAVLLISMNEWLSDTGRGIIRDLIRVRSLGGRRKTMFATEKTLEGLLEDAGGELIRTMSEAIGKDSNLLLIA